MQQQAHYDGLLAEHYTWMFGQTFAQKTAEQRDLLTEMGIESPGISIDLGCGSGFQTMALAELGAPKVVALDTSAALLSELAEHAGNSSIVQMRQLDLISFDSVMDEPANTIVCMGDTLTHLASREVVSELFEKVAGNLDRGGRFVLSWRDLSSPPTGLDRFISLRASDEKIMSCFLEDMGDVVEVHDLIYVKIGEGWQLRKSSYPKLKLSSDWVVQLLRSAGLTVDRSRTVRGMNVISAVL